MRRLKGLGGGIFLSVVFILTFLTVQTQAQGDYVVFENDEKFGLKDHQGKELIRARFDQLGWSTGLQIPMRDIIGYYLDGWGLVSLKDRNITAPKYYSLEAVHRDLIIASVKGRFSNELLYGTINSNGETIVDFRYHSISKIKDFLIVSERKAGASYYGLLTEQNSQLLELKYKSIRPFIEGLFVFENEKGKKGIVHQKGKILVEASLDSIGQIENGRCFVYSAGKIGVLDTMGGFIKRPIYKEITNELITSEFSKIEILSDTNDEIKVVESDSVVWIGTHYNIIYSNGYAQILDGEEREIITLHNLISSFEFKENLILKTGANYRIINKNGKMFSTHGYEAVKYDDHYLYVKENNLWSIFNAFGRKVSNRVFQDVLEHSNNLTPVRKKKYWGYIDHKGDRAISFKYDRASQFNGRMAKVEYLGFKMLINQFGEQIGEPSYDSVRIIAHNLALVKKKSRTDLLDHHGAVLFQTFNQLEDHPLGFLEKTHDGEVGLLTSKGEIIFDPIYQSLSFSSDGDHLILKTQNRVGLALPNGRWLIKLTNEYEDIMGVNEGKIGIKKDGKWGFINKKKQLLIANRYDSVRLFDDDLAAVLLGGNWGYIDSKERLVIQPRFMEVGNSNQGLTIVKRNGLSGLIGFKGRTVIGLDYDQLTVLQNGKIKVEKGGKVGIFDTDGGQVIPVAFSDIRLSEKHYIVSRRNLSGVMDNEGQYVIPLKYSEIRAYHNLGYQCITKPESIEY